VHTITEQAGTRRGSIGTDRCAGTLVPLDRSAAPPDSEQTHSSTYIDDCIQGTVMIAMDSRAEPINFGELRAGDHQPACGFWSKRSPAWSWSGVHPGRPRPGVGHDQQPHRGG
jgi:hypothetical protein